MRILIIGGVAGGMSAATRARRINESADIIVIEKGGFISFANCGLPYHLAGKIESEEKLLLTTPHAVAKRFRIDARVGHEALSIDRATKTVAIRKLADGSTYTLAYDKLILAPGANPVALKPLAGQLKNVFFLRSMEDTRAIRAYLDREKPAHMAIVGGGFIGLEMAESMRHRGLNVTLIERNPHVLPPLDPEMALPVNQELLAQGVVLHLGKGLRDVESRGDRATHLVLEDGTTLGADIVLMSIGVTPNTELAAACGLEIGKSGGIQVDEFQRTSDPDIYAVGDASEVRHGVSGLPVRIPLAGPANRQGRLAGEHAAGGKSHPMKPVMGTAAVQVFGINCALTGLSERVARTMGRFDVDVAYVTQNHHAGYYPGASAMRLKLVYERTSRKVLGAQAVGGAGVDKRIDVVATLMHFAGTIDDLAQVDLAYAPQFGSAKDALHQLAFVAQNQADGVSDALRRGDISSGMQVVDVRTPGEFAQGAIEGAVNIPVDELRERLGELDATRSTVTYCAVGQRGHIAQRVLVQSGFVRVKNLKGGYSLG